MTPISKTKHSILVSHFVILLWAKPTLGRFRDAVLLDFSRFPAGSDDCLNEFFTDPVIRDIAEDMSQGLRICVRAFCLLCS